MYILAPFNADSGNLFFQHTTRNKFYDEFDKRCAPNAVLSWIVLPFQLRNSQTASL